MNLEQIVKETVAKIVAEKTLTAAEEKKREEIVKAMKKDFKGPAPAMYAIATDKAKKLAEDNIDEAILTEDIGSLLGPITLIVSGAALGGHIGALAAHFLDAGSDLGPIDRIKQWWKDRKDDKAVKSIIAKIKSDPELIAFFKMSETQQRGKFRKLVATKLSAEELQYLNRINKSDLQQNELNEESDHEVSMAQNSLDSIIRSAMELKAKIGDQEIDIPAWIQDHITNSENYIEQASQGYHEYENGGHEEMNEEYDFVKSAIESASGDKISHTEEDDYGRTIYWSTKNPNVNYFVGQGGEFEGKIYLYNGETGERYPIGDLKHYGDGQNHSADDDMHESQQELEEFMIRRWQHYAGIK